VVPGPKSAGVHRGLFVGGPIDLSCEWITIPFHLAPTSFSFSHQNHLTPGLGNFSTDREDKSRMLGSFSSQREEQLNQGHPEQHEMDVDPQVNDPLSSLVSQQTESRGNLGRLPFIHLSTKAQFYLISCQELWR
jgi:hypothetical protein